MLNMFINRIFEVERVNIQMCSKNEKKIVKTM